MNILLINHYAGAPNLGMEFRPYYFAREWTKRGHNVTILAGDYSHLRQNNPQIGHDFEQQIIDGITYSWVKTGDYSGNGVKRAITMIRFCTKLFSHAKEIKKRYEPDVVISSSTYPIDTFPAQRIAKLSGARLIHEVHDMWPETPKYLGGMSKYNPFIVMMQIGENSAYKHSDKVVSLLPLAKEYMISHGLRPDKFVHIPNGICTEDWEHPKELLPESAALLRLLKNENKFIVGYFGGHALSNALDVLLKAAKDITDTSIHFVLVGDGSEKKYLINYSEELKLNNVTFMSPVAKEAIPALCKYFDCTYMGSKASPLYRFGISLNKMYDAMMAKLPIICAISTPATPVSQSGCGFCVESEDVHAISEAVLSLKAMKKNELEKMGLCGYNMVTSQYTYEKLAEKFELLFEREKI